MPKAPDFSTPTILSLAHRAGLICSKPDCSTLTVGPSEAAGHLRLKLGEAAHIKAARKGEARFEQPMTDDDRADISNGIWLCASCHTMIDKNNGIDFPSTTLHEWKVTHESIIASLLKTHRSPLPMLRRFTEEGAVTQEAVDCLEQHGALFVDPIYEVDNHVIQSIDRLKKKLERLPRKITYDLRLKEVLKELVSRLREFMNMTSRFPVNLPTELMAMRGRVGVLIIQLRDEFGCTVSGQLNGILPAIRAALPPAR